MRLEEYFKKFPRCKRPESRKDKTFGNYSFITEIFYPRWGERGLDKLINEYHFIDNEKKRRRIDFVLKGSNGEYAIEVDDSTHYQASHEKFSDDQLKKNSIIEHFEGRYRTIPLTDILENKTRAIDTLLRFFVAEPEFNVNSQTFISGEPKPNEVQKITLERLLKARKEGKNKGLVCYATGLGKTYLSAFDAKKFGGKTLFVVHRDEILKKSQKSFKAVWPEASSGFFNAEEKNTKAKIIFASVQTLYREENLLKFKKNQFDYIIFDETHHSSDENVTYTEVLNHFKPKFLLGLSATPERADDFDILSEIYDGNMIDEIRTEKAIEKGYLVPYQWFRHKDNVDYSNIRWGNRKQYEEDLNELLVINKRDKLIIKKYKELKDPKPKKTLAFCVNIKHTVRLTGELSKAGIKAAVIHSDTNSSSDYYLSKDQRKINTKNFIDGSIEVACVVDIFNEGIDIKQIDCLLLLRPTNSSTIAIQQFGRGLRLSDNKFKLRVMDFVGEHQRNALGVFEGVTGTIELPEKELYYYDNKGNEIFFDKEVIDIFRQEEALYNPKIDKKRIPQQWKDWGDYLAKQGKYNLYSKLGNQKKDLITQLKGCKIYKDNPEISFTQFDKKLEEIAGDTSGSRTMFLSRVMGFLDKDGNMPTKVYEEISMITSNFEEIEKYKYIIESQLQKICYWNRSYRKEDIRNPNSKSFNREFKNFMFVTLYKVILDIGDKTKIYEITYDEYRLFIFIARNYSEHKDITNHILSLRKETEKFLIIRYLNDSTKNKDNHLDDRFDQMFKYSTILNYNEKNKYLRIDKANRARARSITDNFEKKLKENKIPYPLENGERGEYEENLYNPKPLWEDN